MAVQFKKSFTKMLNLTTKNWKILGDNAAVRLRKEIRDKKFFKGVPYTEDYRLRKIAGKAGRRGVSVSSTSSVPDLTLSGKFLNSIKRIKSDKNSTTIGPSPLFHDLKRGLAEDRRDISNDKLVDIIGNLLVKDIEKILNKNIKFGKEIIKINL